METRTNMLGVAFRTIALLTFFASGQATAQMGQAIPAKALVEPWMRAKEVVLTLPESFESDRRAELDRKLGQLDDQLADVESELESVAVSIVSKPEFVYDTAASSDKLAAQLAALGSTFESLFRDSPLRGRPDLQAAQESLDALRKLLANRNLLERDVLQADGAGGKNEIQALAAHWWAGVEGVKAWRAAIAEVRPQLAEAQGNGRN